MSDRGYIDTNNFSSRMRERLILHDERKVLIAKLTDSNEARDAYTRINCHGYGRIRHFRNYTMHLKTSTEANQLPKPLLRGHPLVEVLHSQVFQLAACNWRCWYCFVDDNRLSGDRRVAKYFTANELVDMYLGEEEPPDVLDLSGGQPDLVPEWSLWMMQALEEHGLRNKVFLWSDDNLSNRYFWKFLTRDDIKYMANFPKYSRVACFKGFDEASFAFNTRADPCLFNQQFEVYRDLLLEGFDMYAYVTFTALAQDKFTKAIGRFVDKLQEIHPNLPLRTVPLKIIPFTATRLRSKQEHQEAIKFQHDVYNAWVEELGKRFTAAERNLPFSEVPMRLN